MQADNQQQNPDTATRSLDDVYWCRDHRGRRHTYEEALKLVRDFHGHIAPGLVIGLKMVTVAMQKLPEDILFDVICETRDCLPDAVQMLTLCTIGNYWLKIKDIKRFALTLYNKSNGNGVRVFLDPAKLKPWPEFYDWFYKRKIKNKQNFEQLMSDIRNAGDQVLTIDEVRIQPRYLIKPSKGQIGTCPLCGEAYPLAQGGICKGCQGEAPYETLAPSENKEFSDGPPLKIVPVEQAAGKHVLHDMTQIVPGVAKGPAFHHGQLIRAADICRLKQMGRQYVYIEEKKSEHRGWIHEDDAALAFAKHMAGSGVSFQGPPREGKINLHAARDGLLVADNGGLEAFNRVNGAICASRKSFEVVVKGERIAATRAIPLYMPENDFNTALTLLSSAPLFNVLPLRQARIGILVTGTEIFRGLVKDSFIPIIHSKVASYGCEVLESRIVPDDRKDICQGVKQILKCGVDLLVTTAGLSVDPDDVTRQGLIDAGCSDLLYGAPILPGAMTLLAKIDNVQVIGVPACGLYHKTTSFDVLLPRLLAGMTITRNDLAALGHGAFCQNCQMCTFPKCSFGR
jgi:formylmethanofuran dehydrogenase subunit E